MVCGRRWGREEEEEERMKNFSLGHYALAQEGVITTLTIAVALAVGFVLSEVVVRQVKRYHQH